MKTDQKKGKQNRTKPFHDWLGSLLKELLVPVDVTVVPEFRLMSHAPRTDYYLLGNQEKGWTPEQRERLCDGIRDLKAPRVLIEFKYTESVNEDVLSIALGDWVRYRKYAHLSSEDVRMVVLSSKTTDPSTLETFGYELGEKPGVYHTQKVGFRNVDLVLINQLDDTAYNAPYKLFASRNKQIDQAFELLQKNVIFRYSKRLRLLVETLYFGLKSPKIIQNEVKAMTIEEFLDKGPDIIMARWEKLPIEEKMKYMSEDEMLERISDEKRLDGISVDKLEEYLKKLKNQ